MKNPRSILALATGVAILGCSDTRGATAPESQAPPPVATSMMIAGMVCVPAPDDPPAEPVPPDQPLPRVAGALVDVDFTKATSREHALRMLTEAGGTVNRHVASYANGTPHPHPSNVLDLIGFIPGEGLTMIQPAGSSVTPYLRFDHLGSRPGIWQMVERRFSAGWTTQGERDRAAGYKVDGIGFVGGNGSARLELANTDQYIVNNYFVPVPGNRSTAATLEAGTRIRELTGGHVEDEWTGRRAHRYAYFYHAQGKRAIWRAFLDGRELGDASVTFVTVNAPRVNRSSAGMNFNKIRTKSQHIVIRRIIILDSTLHPNPWGLR